MASLGALLALFLSYLVAIQCATENSYIGAVVEYAPTTQNVTANVLRFIELIVEAKEKHADIIVFPETALNGHGLCDSTMLTVVPHPDEKIAPCNMIERNFTEALQKLSCAAKENNIYLVINTAEIVLCTLDDTDCDRYKYRYNTNVVFDRKGVVIARYRKYNLFGEFGTNTTPDPEISVFETDFGVRFGTFICFDLMFDAPSLQIIKQLDVKNIVFSTFWFSELPFLTAVQAQQMWAYSNDVNFLGSGHNLPSRGSAGSGIYNGRNGALESTFPDAEETRLLVAELPKDPKSEINNQKKIIRPKAPFEENSSIYLKSEKLDSYVSISLEDISNPMEVCHEEFCCTFSAKFVPPSKEVSYRYRALVFDGVRTFDGTATGGIQACAIVTCQNETVTSCGVRVDSQHIFNEISIAGTFKKNSALQMPSTLQLLDQLLPLDSTQFNYSSICDSEKCNITMSLTDPLKSLITFGIYGRDFTRDGQNVTLPPVPGSASTLAPNMFLFAVILSTFYVALK